MDDMMEEALQIFREESAELLEEAESALLSLEEDASDTELVNGVFRSFHTIKGSSGLFGFEDVVAFTHVAESVLGRVRGSELALDDELLSLMLRCRDHMALLVEKALDGNAPLSDDERGKGDALVARLETYLQTETVTPSAAAPAAEVTIDDATGTVANENWHISLHFGRDALRNGMDPLAFLRYLPKVGDILSLVTLYDRMPQASEMDPEDCYLGFELDLRSEADKQAIEEVFEFARDDCDICILPPHSTIAGYAELIDALPDEHMPIGEILVKTGAITPHELAAALQYQQERNSHAEADEPVPVIGALLVERGSTEPEVIATAVQKQKAVKNKQSLEQQSVRVNASKLDSLIDLVGELVISGANSRLLAAQQGDMALIQSQETMSRLVEDIRDTTLGLRMVQVGDTFNRFRRVVREVSKELGKKIDFRISGGDTELDKTVTEKIADPLMHLVRNAMDHGLETPEGRLAAGKPETGLLSLDARHDSGSIVIEIRDDGGGLRRDKIFAKALSLGLIENNQGMSDRDIFRLIFEPGFSTADQVTNLSGRGVGMDVVRKNIDALRGQVDVDSVLGQGTTFTIRLPLTLAIIDGFLVRVGGSPYVIPLDMVVECIELDESQTDSLRHSDYINLRDKVLPFVRLGEWFDVPGSPSERESIIVVRFAGEMAGIVVDQLFGEYQTVIKPLGKVFQNLRVISGATILGSGEVAMIIDVAALVKEVVDREPTFRGSPGALVQRHSTTVH